MGLALKNQSYTVGFPLFDANGDLVSGATSLDSEVSKDGGAFADCSNEASEVGSSGMYTLTLTASEMNADTVLIVVKSSDAKTMPLVLYPVAADWPSAATVADTVWDELTADHQTANTFGQKVRALDPLNPADTADAVWAAPIASYVGVGTTAGALNDILTDTGSAGVAIATATAQAIADEILKRGVATVEDSADAHSLAALVLAAFESAITGNTWTIKKTDGSTFTTKTVTTDANADPIVSVT